MAVTSVVEHPVRKQLADIVGCGPSRARVRVALLMIVLGFVALASFIAVRTPAWESADEPGHVLNIETLVNGHWYGIDLGCRPNPQISILSCNGDEAQQAPLYYVLLAGWQQLAGLHAQPPPTHLLTFGRDNGEPDEFFLHHPARGYLLWLRFGNIILGAATVVMAFLVARVVARDEWTPVVAAAVVAFLPRFVFLSAFVTNDNLVNLLGAVLTFCALRFSQRVTSGWMIATGAIFGLLVTTKLSVLPLALIVPFLALMASTWGRRLSLFAYGALSALAVSAWYLVQNWVRYGDPLARHASAVYQTRIGGLGTQMGVPYIVKDPLHLAFVDVPKRIASNVWYSSGWGQFHWQPTIGFLITCAVLALFLGLIHQGAPKRVLLVLGAISVLSLACVWLLAFQTATYGDRYAFVGITAMATLLALALERGAVALRCVLPAVEIVGCLFAIHQDVLGIHWSA